MSIDPITKLASNENLGDKIAIGSSFGSISLMNLEDMICYAEIKDLNCISDIKWISDDVLVASSYDRTIK